MNKTKGHLNSKNEQPSKWVTAVPIPAGIAIVTWLFLKVCLNNQFTNWDDVNYITLNPLIKDISGDGLKAIFSSPVMGNYHPFTVLSYAIEYSMVGLEPWLYHFDSLLLHLIVTVLVYGFVNVLTGRRVAAVVAALLSGLHPMHVESVAWISGRKDELCAAFYILTCISHVYYLRETGNKKSKWYFITLLLFICSLLSKPVAVSLPLSLLLIDYFENRAWRKGIVYEKIPHFIIAVAFGIIAVKGQYSSGAITVQSTSYNALERVALGGYALITYLWKALLPLDLRCFYPYPGRIPGTLPLINYLYPVAVAAIIFITWKFARKNKVIVFGSLFFLINIALMLQFIPVGNAIVAERYAYIPYLGLFFIAGWYVSEFTERSSKDQISTMVPMISLAYILTLGYYAHERCMVWHDSVTLWTDELAKEPARVPVAYDNLSFIYYDRWQSANDPFEKRAAYDSAFYLMKRSTELWPDNVDPYQGLGMLYFSRHNYDSADYCFKTALRLHPTPEGYANYGNLLVMIGKSDAALEQYNIAISQNPDMYAPYLNRGKILRRQNHIEEAMKDFSTAISINPKSAESYYERSFCDTQMVSKALALRDVELAVSLGYKKVDSSYYRSLGK